VLRPHGPPRARVVGLAQKVGKDRIIALRLAVGAPVQVEGQRLPRGGPQRRRAPGSAQRIAHQKYLVAQSSADHGRRPAGSGPAPRAGDRQRAQDKLLPWLGGERDPVFPARRGGIDGQVHLLPAALRAGLNLHAACVQGSAVCGAQLHLHLLVGRALPQ